MKKQIRIASDVKGNSLTEDDVKRIAQEEIRNQLQKQYWAGITKVPPHNHDGNNSLRVSEDDLLLPTAINGTIDMAQATTYTLYLTGNGPIPRQVTFIGGALNTTASPKVHAMVVGSAVFGSNQQFQPDTSVSVKTGPVVETIIQGSASIIIENTLAGSAASTIIKNSQGHIVYVEYPSGTPVVVANIKTISNSSITVEVATLASNWSISGLWQVT